MSRRIRADDAIVTFHRSFPPSRKEQMAYLMTHVRSLGCNCSPEITLPEPMRLGAATEAEFAHDEWCSIYGGCDDRGRD